MNKTETIEFLKRELKKDRLEHQKDIDKILDDKWTRWIFGVLFIVVLIIGILMRR